MLSNDEDFLVCPNRSGMEMQVMRRKKDESRYREVQILRKHDMIINSLLMSENLLLSAGWDARIAFWVFCFYDIKLLKTSSENE